MKLISPSMMCANFANLENEVRELEAAGIDMFHMDIMDGQFVPNFGMGLQDYELISQITTKPLDAHLMIENPSHYVKLFSDLGASLIYIHPEADRHPARTIDIIHQLGKKAGIAIDPDTALATVRELLPLVDAILVMTVNPGFAGQKFLDAVLPKLQAVCQLKQDFDYIVGVDGAISPERIQQLSKLGVSNFVVGTSALFGKSKDYKTIIDHLKQI
ncbi:ribulose phosphate epimerase [Loigolactobacillus coryniformis subsp. coryniformis]|nr:ribulose-phosphate 3-epimerase [Loigolactobacillus coryniformis]ATO56171.1 ribulose-phosphate 3-epimerase [Loigolactobacillus coryniformis subsp. coryniformis KCTC 3167 = DSM 20001]OEH89251.1 ribulose phosphate epimerase [Loigolactobacillus coryniformis subsp. coryniformis]